MIRSYVGGVTTRRMPLQPGEMLLKEASGGCALLKPRRRVYWDGKLYLTSRRVIWMRYRLAFPLPRTSTVEIPLQRIKSVDFVRGSLMKLPGIIIETRENDYQFGLYGPLGYIPIGSGKTNREFFAAIQQARTSHGSAANPP
jgi:hypothetical protein